MTATTEGRKPNRLIHEKSPYLLQHAYNPVDWYPWGEEAFARARKEDKPIFLSIGYSTCHWCHVMERESFENDEVAALMNKYFVCIKLDREERPDIDKIYMTATQATTGSGGWPMSVFLTHDLKPFFCGTYFPPESKWGRPGFKELLQRVHDVWEANHEAVLAQAGKITEILVQHSVIGRDGTPSRPPLDAASLGAGVEQFRQAYDAENGGFGGAPKFPRPVVLNFLFRQAEPTPDPSKEGNQASELPSPGGVGGGLSAAQDMALHTLRKMGEGGLFDQLGGGFHRYSVDDRWLVSHFEKMLYDQAQLVCSYIDAYQITHDAFFADIARRTCDYVLRDLTSPDGGFYSAEDADSEGVEGKFYVWTRAEVEKILGDRAENFCRAYDVTTEGNWEHGNNVLHVVMPGDFAAERAMLFAARDKRIRPHRDEKVLTSWNGMMISALCRAAQCDVDRASRPITAETNGRDARSTVYLGAAQRAAKFILKQHFKDGRLWRTSTVPAVVDDYACFANALVDLYETDFDPAWLKKTIELSDEMLRLFYDTEHGGFFMTTGNDASVILRTKEDYDGAEPSGNSVATLLLLRLAQFTDNEKYRSAAEKTLELFGNHLRKAPHAVPQMLCALDFYLAKPKQIILTGPDPALLRVIRDRYLPNKIVMMAGEQNEPRPKVDGKATAYVCVNFACQLPTNDPATLTKLLQ